MKKLLFSVLALLMACGLAWADGVKVSGTVTPPDETYVSGGYVMLLDAQGALVQQVSVKSDYNSETYRTTYKYEFTEVAAATYTLRVAGNIYVGGKNVLYSKTEENIEVAAVDVAKDISLEEDGQHVLMMVTGQKPNQYGYGEGMGGVEISCQVKGGATLGTVISTAPENGNPAVAFYCDTLSTYVVTLKKAGYKDTVHETVAWAKAYEYATEKSAVSLSIIMQEDWGEEVTLSGSVAFGNEENLTLTERLKLVCTKNGSVKTLYSNIENGRYSFTGVPKEAADTLYIVETVTTSYGSTSEQVSGLLQIKTPAKGALNLADVTETATQNIELERIGIRVKGFVKDATTGNGLGSVTVKIGDESVQTVSYSYGGNQSVGDFVFNAIKETHLTVDFSKTGYGTVTKDTTVAFEATGISGIVDLDTIVMAPQASEYTFSGKAGVRSSGSEPSRPMEGVAVELWSAVRSESGYVKVEMKDTDTTDAEGNWTLVYSGFENDLLYIVIKHDSIETTETMSSASGFASQSQGGYLAIYGESKYPLLLEMENGKARQDFGAAKPTVKLTWEWPEELLENYDMSEKAGVYSISSIEIYRQTKGEQSKDQVGYIGVNYGELPVEAFVDSATQYALEIGKTYTYSFDVRYSKPRYKTVTVEDPNHFTVTLLAEEPEYYNLTLGVNDDEMGTVTGAGEYAANHEVIINAIANEGYQFTAWVSGSDTIARTAEHKVVMTRDSSLTAVFMVQPVVVVPDSFNLVLNTNATMGTVTGAGRYEKGTEVTIKATARQGYDFVAWLHNTDTVAKTAEHKVVLISDSTLTAVFVANGAPVVPDSVTLTLAANDAKMGSVEGAGKYEKNTEVTIKATANDGYVFVAWMSGSDTVAKTAEYKLTLVSDSSLTAVFAVKTANEEREQAAWNVYVENQTIVLRSDAACQYDVYNMAGALVKRAKTNANEYRIAVSNSGLYIIRRISATGISVKKVMVR